MSSNARHFLTLCADLGSLYVYENIFSAYQEMIHEWRAISNHSGKGTRVHRTLVSQVTALSKKFQVISAGTHTHTHIHKSTHRHTGKAAEKLSLTDRFWIQHNSKPGTKNI